MGEGSEAVSEGEEYFIIDVSYECQLLVIIEIVQLSDGILIFLQAPQPVHSHLNLTLGMALLLPGLWLQQVGWGVRMTKLVTQDFLSPIWCLVV